MNFTFHNLARFGVLLAALAVCAALPAVAGASGIGFRNDTKNTVVVKCSTVVNGMVRSGPTLVIQPGKTAWDINVPAGKREIKVYDNGQPGQLLNQRQYQFQDRDTLFVIQPGPAGGSGPRVRIELAP